jgi:hypothetical protein
VAADLVERDEFRDRTAGAKLAAGSVTAHDRAIVVPPLSPALTALWHLLFDLSEQMREGWRLIGGQTVTPHGLEHGRTDARPGVDADVLVDIRAAPMALRQVVGFFTERSFGPDPGPDWLLHRFKRRLNADFIIVDLLAPDNMGKRADLTTSPPGLLLDARWRCQAERRHCVGSSVSPRQRRPRRSEPGLSLLLANRRR